MIGESSHIRQKDITVAVWMVTYNHEPYITTAIESVLNQSVSFKIHLYIGEDCSTDKTGIICQSYADKFPHLISLIRSSRNIGATNNGMRMHDVCFSSNAKYIALLEGDDYWTDNHKLQKQVNCLEENPDLVACFHNVILHGSEKLTYNKLRKKQIDLTDLAYGDYMHTCALMYRNQPDIFFPFLNRLVPLDDDSMGYCLLMNGRKAKYLDEIMAAYRTHPGGIWSLQSQKKKLLWTMAHQQATIMYYNDDILSPILKKRLKASSIVLMKMAIRKVDPILFLKGLKIFIFG